MIVVTGAGGVVGRAVVSLLEALGESFVAVVRRPTYPVGGKELTCDLARSSALKEIVEPTPSGIVHLAAAVPHSPHYADTEESAALTRSMDEHVFVAAESWGCPVVYASTCGLYDRRSRAMKTEDDELPSVPASPYFAAKLAGERLFSRLSRCSVLRIAAPIGPGVPAGLVATRFISSALAGNTLNIWGTGSREQNYVASDDIATAMVRAVQLVPGGIINIAASEPTTMLELARTVVAVLGKGQIELTGEPDPREGETARYMIARAKRFLDWEPTTDIEQSIRRVAASFDTPVAQ